MVGKEGWFTEKNWLAKGERSYDAMTSPWRGVLAFVNWPIGVERRGRHRGDSPSGLGAERRVQAEVRSHRRLGAAEAL
jgi:hypothetical protein